MGSLVKEGLLRLRWAPGLQFVRGRRVNVQRPRPPHYDRALALALLRPRYDWETDPQASQPTSLTCRKIEEIERYKVRPDNPLERILARELREKFEKKAFIGFLHANPIKGEDMFDTRVKLKKENMTLEIHSKHTVKLAVEGTRYEPVHSLFVSHSALVFCDEARVAALLKILKKIPQYVLMAGLLEGRLLSLTQLEAFAQLGNITAARSQLVAVLNSPGSSLVSHLTQAQNNLVTALNQITEPANTPPDS